MPSTRAKTKKVHLVKEATVEDIEAAIRPVIEVLDSMAKHYDHEEPWRENYTYDPEFWLHRVHLGAVGRICICKHAIMLGLKTNFPAKPVHFISDGHYRVFRVARATGRRAIYMLELETRVNNFLSGNDSYKNNRFVNFHKYKSYT